MQDIEQGNSNTRNRLRHSGAPGSLIISESKHSGTRYFGYSNKFVHVVQHYINLLYICVYAIECHKRDIIIVHTPPIIEKTPPIIIYNMIQDKNGKKIYID